MQGPVHKYLPFIKCLQVMRFSKIRITSFSDLMAAKMRENKYYTGYILEVVLWDKLRAKRSKQMSWKYITKMNL